MAKYLNKFRSTLGPRQGDQIIKLLNKKRAQGQIRTIEEFSRRLDELLREVTSTTLQPSIKLFPVTTGQIISSEQFNIMLERLQDDLEVAFEEALNIDEIQISHEALIRDVTLKNLRSGLAELKSQINTYHFLNIDLNGFTTAIESTFSESQDNRSVRGIVDNILFTDPRTSETILSAQDAVIELTGQRLTLPKVIGSQFYDIIGIRQIFDDTTLQSTQLLNSLDTSLYNIIDNQSGTHWIQSIALDYRAEWVKTKLSVLLGNAEDIDIIEIEPVSGRGIYLEAIHYLDGNNVIQKLSVDEQLLESSVGIRFPKVSTRELIFTFRNENGVELQYETTSESQMLDMVSERNAELPARPKKGSHGIVTSLLNNFTTSINQAVNTLANTLSSSVQTNISKSYEYTIGLDNIRIGLQVYDSLGIYVSKPLKIDAVASVGLKTTESRPYINSITNALTYTSDTYNTANINDYYLGSIEHWVIKQDFNTDDILLNTVSFPILPLNKTRVIHERLLLTEKSSLSITASDTGTLMFYTCHQVPDNIYVYRNGILLPNIDGTSPPYTDGWLCDDIAISPDQIPNSGSPMKTKIRIVGSFPGDIFTVSYTPAVSTTMSIPVPPYSEFLAETGLQIVDLIGNLTIRRNSNQIVSIDPGSDTVAYSKLYLMVLLRQNTADITLSPTLEDYIFAASNRDIAKFEDT